MEGGTGSHQQGKMKIHWRKVSSGNMIDGFSLAELLGFHLPGLLPREGNLPPAQLSVSTVWSGRSSPLLGSVPELTAAVIDRQQRWSRERPLQAIPTPVSVAVSLRSQTHSRPADGKTPHRHDFRSLQCELHV